MSTNGLLRAGVIGWPITHSLSPRLHGFWLQEHCINGTYEAIAIEPDHLERDVRNLMAQGYQGINATLPHKEALLSLADEAGDFAQRVGAANTLVFDDGRIIATNTDGFGFIENLKQGSPGRDFGGMKAMVIGAGGAARAVIAALQDNAYREVIITNRTKERAHEVMQVMGGETYLVDWNDRSAALADVDLLVNTTSLGMTGQPPLEINLDDLPSTALVTDIVYNPLETPLLTAAKLRGNQVVDGIGMLLHQARPGFEAWFGQAPDVTPVLRDHVLAGLAAS